VAKYEIVERNDGLTTWWIARDDSGCWVNNTQTLTGADECERKLRSLAPSRPDVVVKEIEL